MCTCHIFDMNFRWYVNIMNINNNCMNHTLPNCLPNIQLRTLRRTWCGNLSRHGHKTPFTPSKRLVKTLRQNLVFRFGFGSSAKTQAVQERWKVQLEVARMSEDFKFTAFWSYDRVGSFWAAPCSTSHRINDFVSKPVLGNVNHDEPWQVKPQGVGCNATGRFRNYSTLARSSWRPRAASLGFSSLQLDGCRRPDGPVHNQRWVY